MFGGGTPVLVVSPKVTSAGLAHGLTWELLGYEVMACPSVQGLGKVTFVYPPTLCT